MASVDFIKGLADQDGKFLQVDEARVNCIEHNNGMYGDTEVGTFLQDAEARVNDIEHHNVMCGDTEDDNFVEGIDETIYLKTNQISVEEGDGVLDSEGDGVHLSQTNDVIQQAHHLHLLIKALESKIENHTLDAVVPPKDNDYILRTIRPNDAYDVVEVDNYEDDYMLMLNDEEKPVKSSLNDMELEQKPDKIAVKQESLEQLPNAPKGKIIVLEETVRVKVEEKPELGRGRSFWLSLSCRNTGKADWLNDHVYFLVNEPKTHWCLAELEIRIGVVTFYDSLGWAGGSRRCWWRRMKKLLLEKLTVYLVMHGIFESKGISANDYKITYKYADAPFQASLFGDCGIWVCIFIYRLCRNLPLTVDDALETALAYSERMLEYFWIHKIPFERTSSVV
uniref:Phospholipase-like protein n=1 Tax=Tanacetum cinerariifolium TaxID=118510 RepID=A0A6L2LET3_TANCI|nr:phospholipase-like protein [Tanacetum cinerariifolium]